MSKIKKNAKYLIAEFEKEIDPVLLEEKIWESVRAGFGELAIVVKCEKDKKISALPLNFVYDLVSECASKTAKSINKLVYASQGNSTD